jgi:hypothetical protein
LQDPDASHERTQGACDVQCNSHRATGWWKLHVRSAPR